MSSLNSRVDIIVLGATGFTGRKIVKNLASINKESEYSDLTWGISGRSKEKLNSLLIEVKNQGVNIKDILVLESDVTNEMAIEQVCSRAKVLVNAAGPYTVIGDPVVKSCIKTKTHYVDISAELHHMISIYRSYHKAAEEANVLIISACGFGSLPGVMGFAHLEKHFNGTLQSVECYTEIEVPSSVYSIRGIFGGNNCLVHYGTWDSLVHELKNFPEYFRLKKETFPELLYDPEPEKMKKSFFHRKDGKIWFPYPGPDANIIDWTQQYLHEKKVHKPVNFKMYTTMPKLIHLILTIPVFFCYYWLSYFKCFRTLLRRYPRFFTLGIMSHDGPKEETMNGTKFSFSLMGTGWEHNQKKTKTLKVFGTHPYELTALACLFSAITVIKDESLMAKGGVLTSGAAFYNTRLVELLNSRGLKFEFMGK